MTPYFQTENGVLYCGAALDVLLALPDESVHCCVTSPPYWGLRDYGVEGQLGLEQTPEEYVAKMVEIFREVRRVLRSDGTAWVNLGDTYAAARSYQVVDNKHRDVGNKIGHSVPPGCKPKDLVGIPWRVAFALQADGWYLRSCIPWIKRNCMPESCKDRPTTAIEYIFLLSKSQRYFYDHEGTKLPASPDSHRRYARGRSDDHKWVEGGPGNQTIARSFEHMREGRYPGVTPKSQPEGSGIKANESFHAAIGDLVEKRARRNSDWFFDSFQGLLANEDGYPLAFLVNSQGFKGAHFATFPEKLVEPCILAGCPEDGTVLDPFSGSGTTGIVAYRHRRKSVLIDLSEEYAEMIVARIEAETQQRRLF